MQSAEIKAQLSQALIAEPPTTIEGVGRTFIGTLAPLGKDLVKQNRDLVLSLFDDLCVAIDIPRLPEFIEKRIEAAVRGVLESWIDSL